MPFNNPITADDLLIWETQYTTATKHVLRWLKATAERAGFQSSNEGPEVWLRETAAAAVESGARLPSFEQGKWKDAIAIRGKMLEYWKERLEPWDTQRYEWIKGHEGFARA